MYKIQSVLIKKSDMYNLERAANWIVKNGFKIKKVDETNNYYRFRQISPSQLRKENYNHYVTKPISNDVTFIIAYKNS